MNNQVLRLGLSLFLAGVFTQVPIRAETASMVGNSRSAYLGPFSGYRPGLGQIYNYVTTFDGQAVFPLYPFSGELRPRTGQTGTYEADFATYDAFSNSIDYGSFTAHLPTTDSDGNGLPDVMQRDKAGNAQVSGTVVSDYYGTQSNLTGSISRAPGFATGSFSVTLTAPGAPTVTYNGSLFLYTVSGNCTYSRSASTISFNVSETLPNSATRMLQGSTLFDVINANQVVLRPFTVNGNDGSSYSTYSTTLNRSGTKYIGNLQLQDGGPGTYWRDYINWVVEITDPNDSNHDGIPNLSDPTGPPPAAPAFDFNRDGHPDFLVYNSNTRQSGIWYLNNNIYTGGVYGPTLPAGWTIAVVADFNRDGKVDLTLFNPSTLQTAIWYLNNNVYSGGTYGPTLPSGWALVGTGDFNGDGKPDFALYNAATRQTAIWYLNNNIFVSGAYGPTLPAGWSLVCLADFNGDRKPDFALFNSSTQQTAIWYMSGTTLIGGAYGPSIANGFALHGAADFNGDGKPDFVLFNPNTRQTAIWYLNGATLLNTAAGPAIASGWTLAAP